MRKIAENVSFVSRKDFLKEAMCAPEENKDLDAVVEDLVESGRIDPTSATVLKENLKKEKDLIWRFYAEEHFSWLLPPPHMLQEYEKAYPGITRECVEMLKEEAHTRRTCAIIASISILVGQTIGGVVVLGGFITAVFLAKEGFGGASIVSIFSGLGVLLASILGKKALENWDKESEEESSESK